MQSTTEPLPETLAPPLKSTTSPYALAEPPPYAALPSQQIAAEQPRTFDAQSALTEMSTAVRNAEDPDFAPLPPAPAATLATPQAALPVNTEIKGQSTSNTGFIEPQSPLTQKFTEAEWKAVQELRSQIPAILANAFPDNVDAKLKPVKIWGVTIDPNGPPDARLSVVLVKFLRARNLGVSAARDMLTATLRWRDLMKIDEIMREEFPEEIFGRLGRVYGRDKGGRPVTYNLYGANQDLRAVFGDVQRFIRWRIKLMEQGIALLDFEKVDQMVQIHDYEGATLSSRDINSKNAAAEATNIFQNHYPEFLYKKFFVNVPMLLTWIFWIFKPLVSANTLAKMSVIGSGAKSIGHELLPLIEPKALPRRYGGQAEAF